MLPSGPAAAAASHRLAVRVTWDGAPCSLGMLGHTQEGQFEARGPVRPGGCVCMEAGNRLSQHSVESRDVPENMYGSAPYTINVLKKQNLNKYSCSPSFPP